MIVRRRPSLLDIMFAIHGSTVPKIVGRLGLLAVISVGAVMLVRAHPGSTGRLSAVPFTLIGLALSIFMSFRNTACYDRWWEGRKLWGELLISIRGFARQTASLEAETRAELLRGLCGFANALAARLRDKDEAAAIGAWSRARDWAATPNPTDAILAAVGARCAQLMTEGRISDILHSVLEIRLSELGQVQGGCERIKTTPLPFAYALLLHRTAHLFCLLLPFALAPSLGWWTPLPVVIVGYTFFGLDALGDELEEPFAAAANGLPLDALVRTVEREMLFALGETSLPPELKPRSFLLT
jgi:putative membrane protein